MPETAIREELSKYARKIVEKGMVVGPGGNISALDEGIMYISPSGYALDEIEPEQWTAVELSTGQVRADAARPSSEVLMHLYVYRKNPAVLAVVHTHPPYCIALGTIEDSLPILFPDQAALVGSVAYLPYIVPTTERLAEAASERLEHANALLLGNHGLVTAGRNLREAYYRTEVVEESAKIYLLASAIRPPRRMSEDELAEIQALESEAYRISLLQNLK